MRGTRRYVAHALAAACLLVSAGCALPGSPLGQGSSVTVPPSPAAEAPDHAGPQVAATPSGRRPGDVPAGAQRATVTRHTDGDTLRLIAARNGLALHGGVETTVRLLQVDAPESVHPGQPPECFGAESSARLAELLPLGATAWVVPDRELLDRHGRTLLHLWTAAGVFVNEELVLGGFATAVLFEPNDRYLAVMQDAEEAARSAGRGMWGTC